MVSDEEFVETRNTTNVFRGIMGQREDQTRATFRDTTMVKLQAVGKHSAVIMKDEIGRVLQPNLLRYPIFNFGDSIECMDFEFFEDQCVLVDDV